MELVKICRDPSNTKKYHAYVEDIVVILVDVFYNKGISDKHRRKKKGKKKIEKEVRCLIEKKYFRVRNNKYRDRKKIGYIILEFFMNIVLKDSSKKKKSYNIIRKIWSEKNYKNRKIKKSDIAQKQSKIFRNNIEFFKLRNF
jgi:hypothetical protein